MCIEQQIRESKYNNVQRMCERDDNFSTSQQ